MLLKKKIINIRSEIWGVITVSGIVKESSFTRVSFEDCTVSQEHQCLEMGKTFIFFSQ